MIFDKCQDISLSHSPKGWTDQELGEMWIKKDFEPATATKNVTGGYRLLILDGHNSHCTYGFCKFAEGHKIIIICLPPHMTHALQPCDVACFGPLSSAWKSEVNSASADYTEITKRNLLVFYAKARERALKKSTIISAFAKTGIWPFNNHILELSTFEPSKNTTTEPSQPLPARLPSLLIPIQVNPNIAPNINNPNMPAVSNEARYIIPLPPPLPYAAARADLRLENQMLRDTLRLAEVQLERDFTQMTLMDAENGRLRKRAYAKEKKKAERKETTQAHARLMTSAENLDALAKNDFLKHWKEVVKELGPIFKQIRKEISEHEKGVAKAARDADKARKAEERAAKKAAAEAEKARKKATRAEAAAAKKAAQGRGCGARGVRSRGRGRGLGKGRGVSDVGSEDNEDFEDASSSPESGSEGERSQSSDSAIGMEDDQFGEAYEDMAAAIPPVPNPSTKLDIPPRPRPRPRYRVQALAVEVGDNEELPEGSNRNQPHIQGVSMVNEKGSEAENVAEGENAAEAGCRYPRRLNRTNIHFKLGVDA